MSETLHLKDCPVCASKLSIVHDKIEDVLTVKVEDIAPLARECQEIVTAYKRIKGLGASWQKNHGTRALISAGQLITASGPLGGAVERCLGLLSWLAENKREFDLGTAASHFGEYAAYMAAKNNAAKGRCKICGESYVCNNSFATKEVENCGRHT